MHQLTFAAQRDDLESIENLLQDLGACSITLRDAADQPLLEPALGETPVWDAVQISAQFTNGDDLRAARQALREARAADAPPAFHCETLGERDWVREWLKDFKPMRFGRRLWIVPGGQRAPDPAAAVVHLDPGLAFGTGTHPSTALCLGWLDAQSLHDREVLDYGCGSGILALAALKLGARRALAVDIDPQALQAARTNAERNGMSADAFRVLHPARLKDARTDVLVANILARILIEQAPALADLVRPRGHVALAGILTTQVGELKNIYRQWFDLQEVVTRDGWALLSGQRRA